MTFKSPTAALNEVLLHASIRAERINAEPEFERRAHDLAKRNDRLSSNYVRPVSSQTEDANGRTSAGA